MVATIEGDNSSTNDLRLYVLEDLVDRFSEETISDVDIRNYDDVGELSIEANHDSRSIFDQYRYLDGCQ